MTKNGHKRFELPLRTALLQFEDEFAGAEVRCRLDVPLGLALEFSGLEGENAETLAPVFRRFGDEVLIDWNLDIDGEPVPATGDGFMQVSPAFAMSVLQAWGRAATRSPLVETA